MERLRVIFIRLSPGLWVSELGPLVGKRQTKDERIGMERIQCDRQAGQRIGGNHDRLLRTELILKRGLDVGVDEELHRRGDAVPGRAKRPVEWLSLIHISEPTRPY